MMKLGVALCAAIATVALSSAAFADEMSNTHNMNNAHTMSSSHSMMSHQAMGGHKVTLTGTLTDLSCYTTAGLHGAGHKACAKACLLQGQPFGIQTADGNIVEFLGKGPNDKLASKIAPFLEEKVAVTGQEFTAHGVTGIQIDTITAAQ
jgi:hypothetical protein